MILLDRRHLQLRAPIRGGPVLVATKGSCKNKLAFWRERRAGRCKALRRRRCGDIVEKRQRRRYAPFAAAPRRAAAPTPSKPLRLAGYDSIGHGSRSKCQIILARALTPLGRN